MGNFSTKFGHFFVNEIFLYVTNMNMQAYKQKSEKMKKKVL